MDICRSRGCNTARLNAPHPAPHSGHTIYLARLVRDMFEAVHHLEADLDTGRLRLVGDQVNQPRSNDWVMSSVIEVVVAVRPEDEPG